MTRTSPVPQAMQATTGVARQAARSVQRPQQRSLGSTASDTLGRTERMELCWTMPATAVPAAIRAAMEPSGVATAAFARLVWRVDLLDAGDASACCTLSLGERHRTVMVARSGSWQFDPAGELLHLELDADPDGDPQSSVGANGHARVIACSHGMSSGSARRALIATLDRRGGSVGRTIYARTTVFEWLGVAGGRYQLEERD